MLLTSFREGFKVFIRSQSLLANHRAMSSVAQYKFENIKVESPSEYVYNVQLNRPEKRNAMNFALWKEIKEAFDKIAVDENCRAVVLSGNGKVFCAGIDLMDFGQAMTQFPTNDVGRRAFLLRRFIKEFQSSFTALEKCLKPVIAVVHGACVGGGVDLICAADIRYATKDAWFQIKEVDVGLAADVGTLQRMPKVTGNDSLVRELAFTGRQMLADEALRVGLVSRLFDTPEAMLAGGLEVAQLIASKSPVAVQGTKEALIFARDHGVQESLDQMADWNQAMLQSEDLMKAAMASMQKQKVEFAKL